MEGIQLTHGKSWLMRGEILPHQKVQRAKLGDMYNVNSRKISSAQFWSVLPLCYHPEAQHLLFAARLDQCAQICLIQ